MRTIDINQVKRVYSGKPGCMCGCRGIYRSPSTVTLDELTKYKGYEAEPKEINDRQVKKVVELINYCLSEFQGYERDVNEEYAYIEYQGRAYCAYFHL